MSRASRPQDSRLETDLGKLGLQVGVGPLSMSVQSFSFRGASVVCSGSLGKGLGGPVRLRGFGIIPRAPCSGGVPNLRDLGGLRSLAKVAIFGLGVAGAWRR